MENVISQSSAIWNLGTNFSVDVAFECHDPEAAAIISEKLLSSSRELEIHFRSSAHTVSGYLYITHSNRPDRERPAHAGGLHLGVIV